MSQTSFTSFDAFYPYYLSEHAHPVNRRLHITGTLSLFPLLLLILFLQQWIWLLAIPVLGYGFAWAGHFFVERNKPATFRYPLWSLRADFVMCRQFLSGQLHQSLAHSRQLYPHQYDAP